MGVLKEARRLAPETICRNIFLGVVFFWVWRMDSELVGRCSSRLGGGMEERIGDTLLKLFKTMALCISILSLSLSRYLPEETKTTRRTPPEKKKRTQKTATTAVSLQDKARRK